MKKLRQLYILLSLVMMVVGISITASAESIGSGYSILGIGAGWFLIGISVLYFILSGLKVIGSSLVKKTFVFFVALLLIGLALQFIESPSEAPAGGVITGCPDFDLSASAVTSGTSYITDTNWDEDEMILTVPLTVADSSDGNLSGGGHITGINITIDPQGGGSTTQDILTYTVSSDYNMKYGGEDVLDEDSTGYMAIWTLSDGSTEYYSDSIDITADTTDWAQMDYTFVNGTSSSWVSELSAIGDSLSWHITVSDECGNSQTVTVNAVVVSYTA